LEPGRREPVRHLHVVDQGGRFVTWNGATELPIGASIL
jgi:hypothetical protein